MEKTLLVIDDSAAFREAIRAAGEDHGWMVFASDNLEEIKKWLMDNLPDVVLLDWQLPGQQRQQYIKLLTHRQLNTRTLLISFMIDDARKKFINEYGLAGYRLKPFDSERFEENIRLSEQCAAPYKPNYGEIFNSIEVAINILDRNIDELLSNTSAKKELLTVPQRLIVKWLLEEMEAKKHKAARRLDWDGKNECFLESRLFRLNNGNYWLERDWRSKEEKLHDHEILNLENVYTLKYWLMAMAKLLAQRYAISRFRMYKVARLPNIEEIEYLDNHLVIPFFQSGGGFEPNEEIWFMTGFLAKDNPYTNKALERNYEPQPEFVNDNNPNIGYIRYGEKGTYRVLFSVHGQGGQISALFDLDRRLDHANTLTGFDREVVDIAKRMASDDIGPLSREQWSLMKGLIEDLGQRLAIKLTDGEREHTVEWHKTITKVLKNNFAEAGRSPEMIYDSLSKVCTALAKEWNNTIFINGRVMGTTPWPKSREGHPISTWYIGIITDETHWQAVAGWGDAYKVCRQYGEFELKIPDQTVKSMKPWKAVAIQDFKKWVRQMPDHFYYIENQSINNQFDLIGSWLAVPMQVDGKIRALMVVHSPHAYYFTAFRIGLIEYAAEQFLSLLAAAQRETRARSAFAASVMHEVKNDSHTALMLLDQIQEQANSQGWDISLAEIRYHLEGLNALGQDALDIFQLRKSEHALYQREPDEGLLTTIGKLIKSATMGWCTLYEDTKLVIDMPEILTTRKIFLKRPLALKRVLRVLLHNAFRHGRQRVLVKVALRSHEIGGGNYLSITVNNPADEQTIKNLTEYLNPAIGDLGSSPFIRGSLGLAVAYQLTTEAGGILGDLKPIKTNSGDIEAMIGLAWPITFVDDTLESTS